MFADVKRTDLIEFYFWVENTATRFESLPQRIESQLGIPQRGNPFKDLAATAKREAENLERPFRLGVVGMFKSGKSSVLNSFLRRDILKVGKTETTSVLTEMVYTESPATEFGEVVWADGKTERMPLQAALDFTDIRSKVFDGLSDNDKREKQRNVRIIRLGLHCEFLQNLVILDTPGFGGSVVGDEKAFESLDQVDAALIIFSASKTGSDYELKVAERLSRQGREVVAILNQVDNGLGEKRSEKDLQDVREFITKHFQTLVRDKSGNSLIFEYSAREIIKLLPELRPDSTEIEQAISKLRFWGYAVAVDDAPNSFVANFVRQRYFSSGSEASRMKIAAVRTNLTNRISGVLNDIERDIGLATKAKGNLEEQASDRTRRVEREVYAKIPLIEGKLEDEIFNLVRQFSTEMTEALLPMIDDLASVNLQTFANALKSKDRLAQDFKEEFLKLFPEENTEYLVEDIERKCTRIMQSEWKQLMSSGEKLNIVAKGVDFSIFTNKISDAMRTIALTITGEVTALIAMIFIPGGLLVDAIWVLLNTALSFGVAKELDRKTALAKSKVRTLIRSMTKDLFHKIFRGMKGMNDTLAADARKTIEREGEGCDQLLFNLASTLSDLTNAKKAIEKCREDIEVVHANFGENA